MAKRRVQVKVCDRCPIGKEKPATRTVRFSLDKTTWDIDLCEQHGGMIERELYAWGRLGREVEDADQVGRMFGSKYHHDARRLSELRSTQAAADREHATVGEPSTNARTLLASVSGPQPAAPSDASEYVFTDHARERLEERGVRVIDAIWAASAPTVRRPARQQGLAVHERGGVKVVLNPQTKAIITVAVVGSEPTQQDPTHRKAI